MRLTCPNCDAQYEVEDRAIPEGGRDVQCSSCGHAWFQLPPDVEDRLRDEAIAYGDEAPASARAPEAQAAPATPRDLPPQSAPETAKARDLPAPAPAPASDSAGAAQPASSAEGPAAAPEADQPRRRKLDDNLRNLLREEAAREAQARRADGAPLETQDDLGLEEPAAGHAAADAARRRGRARGDEGAADTGADTDEAPHAPPQGGQRRDLLPDIEEINSSLRASSERDRAEPGAEAETPQERRRGFRLGFGVVLLLAVILMGVYVAAPRIAASVPAASGALHSYVTTVDRGRLWLNGLMNSATQKMRGSEAAGGGGGT